MALQEKLQSANGARRSAETKAGKIERLMSYLFRLREAYNKRRDSEAVLRKELNDTEERIQSRGPGRTGQGGGEGSRVRHKGSVRRTLAPQLPQQDRIRNKITKAEDVILGL